MRKKIAVVVMLLLIMLFCGSCVKLTKMIDVNEETEIPPKVVYLGDSIAAGYGLEGYKQDDLYKCGSYPNILSGRYSSALDGKCGHITVNKAVSGDTTDDLLGDLESGSLDEALAGSDAVVISIGGNDLLNVFQRLFETLGYNKELGRVKLSDADLLAAAAGIFDLNDDIDEALKGFEKNLDRIITKIDEKTDAEIFVQELYNPFEYFSKIGIIVDYTQKKVNEFNRIVNGSSGREGVHRYNVIGVSSAFEGRCGDLTNISLYDIHPNAAGHAVLAEKVNEEITRHTYTYTKQVEVTDEDAVRTLVIICVAGGTALIAAMVLVIVLVRKKIKRDP